MFLTQLWLLYQYWNQQKPVQTPITALTSRYDGLQGELYHFARANHYIPQSIATLSSFDVRQVAPPIVDFIVIDGKLWITGQNRHAIEENYKFLGEYSAFILARNHIQSLVPIAPIPTIVEFSQTNLESAIIPTYRNLQDRIRVHLSQMGPYFGVDVSEVIPREIWRRYETKPHDGICHNSAMVESGIRPFRELSAFNPNIDYFLGMHQIVITENTPKKLVARFGPLSDTKIVKERKSWVIHEGNKDLQQLEMSRYIYEHFTSGNVLCVERQYKSDPVKTQSFVQNTLQEIAQSKGQNLETNFESVLHSFQIESGGGHCLTFLTPSLISESNSFLPHNLMSWESAFHQYTNIFKAAPGQVEVILYYFNLDQEEKLKASDEQLVKTDKYYYPILELTEKHRDFYESFSVKETMPWSNGVRLYDESHLIKNPDSCKIILDFWDNEILSKLNGEFFLPLRKIFESDDPLSGCYNVPSLRVYISMMSHYKDIQKSCKSESSDRSD